MGKINNQSSLLDRTFRISLILKFADGVLEILGGVLLVVVSPKSLASLVTFLTQHELDQDPKDFYANYLVNAAHHLSASTTAFGAFYLLSHGIVKIILVTAVLKNKLWAYPWLIGFLVAFIVYQIYRLALGLSIGLIALTIFDVFIVVLTWIEYKRHKAAAI